MTKYTSAAAHLSPNETYRYYLSRSWADDGRRSVLFVMLNPSTADGEKDDATVRKCFGFASRLGYDKLRIVNLFAYRARDPKSLIAFQGDRVGLDNDWWLDTTVKLSQKVVVAWGSHAGHSQLSLRAQYVEEFLRQRADLYYLGVTKKGIPKHPLMLPYSTKLTLWRKMYSPDAMSGAPSEAALRK